MQLEERIVTFIDLGKFLNSKNGQSKIEEWKYRTLNENGWFTFENVDYALNSIINIFLDETNLKKWVSNYKIKINSKKIGLVMAGNIPAVGFFDLLSVILSGNIAVVKLSSSDTVIMKGLIDQLIKLNADFKKLIIIADKLNDVDAFIATGSDNSSRYFEYYFAKKPNIIRKNRTSIAIFNGNEIKLDFSNLAEDVFKYYGLGCRNVSKIYVPENYDFIPFLDSIEHWSTILNNHKYQNNYDYNKSILLINGTRHLDNGFLLLAENKALVSPISVLHFEYYSNFDNLKSEIDSNKSKIQCIIGQDLPFQSIPFGKSQNPTLIDYADGIDTMEFLTELN